MQIKNVIYFIKNIFNKIEQNFAKVLKKFRKYDINRIIKFNYSEIPNSWKEEMRVLIKSVQIKKKGAIYYGRKKFN